MPWKDMLEIIWRNNISNNREKPKINYKGFPVLGRICYMSWYNVLPNNTNHNLYTYQQQLPLMSLEKLSYERLQIKDKHLLVQTKLKVFTDSKISVKQSHAHMFSASAHSVRIGYSAVVPKLSQNQGLAKV